jgi:hypothetical protein
VAGPAQAPTHRSIAATKAIRWIARPTLPISPGPLVIQIIRREADVFNEEEPELLRITSFVKETTRNPLRARLVEWIRDASVRKTILPLTVMCGCALAVSAQAARTDSLSFAPQAVFQKRTEKAVPEPSRSESPLKESAGKTVSAPIVKQDQKEAIPEPSRSEFPSKDGAGKIVSAPIVKQDQKKAASEPSKSEVVSKDRAGKIVSAPIVKQDQKKAISEPSKSEVVSKDKAGKTVSAPIVKQDQKKAVPEPSKAEFVFKDRTGKIVSAPIIEQYQKNRIVHPMAKIDPRLDPKLSRAATIADERAHAHSKSRCWRYVKEALVASGAVSSYPKTSLAKEAGDELVRDYGFKKLPIRDPYSAPIGSVLVYFKGRNRPGHVEIRTKTGFVSDYRSKDACRSALVGVYAKK